MRLIIIISSLFFLFSFEANAKIKLEKGQSYTSLIEEAFIKTNDIPLPPGNWRITSVDLWQNIYYSIWLAGPKDTWISATLPTVFNQNVKWRESDVCDKNTLAKGKDSASDGMLNQRAEWCVKKHKWDDDPRTYIMFFNQKCKTRCMTLEYYYPIESLSHLSKIDYNNFGEDIFKVFLKAYEGKGSSLDFLSSIWKNNTSSSTTSSNTSSSTTKKDYSSYSDKSICSKATLNDGSGWVQSMQAIDDYVREAWSRSLTIYDCRVLTGRKPLSEVNKVEETSTDSSSIKSKLKELKSMLEDGLITQDDFDKKKNELLEEF